MQNAAPSDQSEVEEQKLLITSPALLSWSGSPNPLVFKSGGNFVYPEPDVLGEIRDWVIIVLHLMAYIGVDYRSVPEGGGGGHRIITDDNPLIEGWGNYDLGEISFFNQVNAEASRGGRRSL